MDKFREYCLQLREHVSKSENNPEAARISIEAISNFERVMETNVLLEENLLNIMAAAKSRNQGPYYIGTNLILNLLKDFPEVQKDWRKLAVSSSAYERWVAISICRDERITFNFAMELVQRAINDKSSKVRLFAIECIFTRCLNQLLPELKKRAQVEKNNKVIQYIEWVISRME